MATPKPFPQAGFLRCLDLAAGSASLPPMMATLSPELATVLSDGDGQPGQAARPLLLQLLQARQAMWQTAFETEQVADDLRRYQKFARPGQPSPHIVQLRQQQGAVRQASSRARQLFITAAAAFVREAGIAVPPRVTLEVFIIRWIEIHVPADAVAATPVTAPRAGKPGLIEQG